MLVISTSCTCSRTVKRGFLLEVLLAKVKYLMKDTVQIVGMSATLPNLHEVSAWLGGSHFSSSYRPVNLDVRLCCGGFYRWSEFHDEQYKQALGQNIRWQLADLDNHYSIFKPKVEGMNTMRETTPAEGSKHSLRRSTRFSRWKVISTQRKITWWCNWVACRRGYSQRAWCHCLLCHEK